MKCLDISIDYVKTKNGSFLSNNIVDGVCLNLLKVYFWTIQVKIKS